MSSIKQPRGLVTEVLILVLGTLGSLTRGQAIYGPVNTAADLDLSGHIIYAINFGNNENPEINGVVFTREFSGSLSKSAEGVTSDWGEVNPNTGDPELDKLLGGIVWKNAGPGGRTVVLWVSEALVVGWSYQIQLLFYTDHARPMDISVDGSVIIKEYDPFVDQGYVTGKGGAVVTYTFKASRTDLAIEVKSNPDRDASLLCGFVLTEIDRVPDFNEDWRVDIEDLVALITHWGQNEASVDLAPPPAGDGLVDRQDLEYLMSYWGQELDDPTLLAHWTLDETEGTTAQDIARGNHAALLGNPVWRPQGGQIDGALELDGAEDCIAPNLVVNPASGPFSVFAWVKGGHPGQVILSQSAGADWLCLDPVDGTLITNLTRFGRQSGPGFSQTGISDGQWHRVGLVWDEIERILYVDDEEVARDAHPPFSSSQGPLTIGGGADMSAGTFWSGLIDDVRIYRRSVTP